MREYCFDRNEDFDLIPQERTSVFEFNNELNHNSTWDSTMGPDGKIYLSLSSELKDMGFARLYEYDYKTNTARKLVDVEELLAPQYRALRPSKFHTSICFMNDGRLVMTTHSTDKGPAHPTWMPFSYYGHMWEGFCGSTIIAYDLKTDKPEIIGMPAPRESLYTSCYDSKHNALYSLGYMRGHLYRYDFETRKTKDLGKVVEGGCFRIIPGPDGNLYSATKTGWIFKIDTDKQQVIDMNYNTLNCKSGMGNFSEGRIGPDGRIYVTLHQGIDHITAIDTVTNEIEDMGSYLDSEKLTKTENFHGIFGMSFDDRGRLWYVVDSFCDPEIPGSPDALFCWDITRKGARPEFKGIVGVPGRISACVSGLFIHENTMLIVDQNHGHAATAVYSIDMSQFDEPGDILVRINPERQSDNMYHAGDPEQTGYNDPFTENGMICAQNPHTFDGDLQELYRPWRELAPDHIEDSPTRALYWDESGTLFGLCGKEKMFVYCVKDGKFSISAADSADPFILEKLLAEKNKAITCNKLPMPFYPGRQYEAVAVVETGLTGGRSLVGTEDGLLAIVDGDRVYSLGMCGYNGPIRAMSTTPDGKTVYGTAGDEEDLGMVFRYTDEKGLELLGCIMDLPGVKMTSYSSNVLSCCKISRDGKKLAIASADRIGTLYIYKLK